LLYDVIVVGSGISGLFAALYAKKSGNKVAVLTKSNPFRSSSAVASGGINAVIDTTAYDSIEQHISDTFLGASGLGYKETIKKMCEDAPYIIKELEEIGVEFDKTEDGSIAQRPFGGTKAKRTCYIADKTGASIVQKLLQKCRKEGIEILANHKFLNITKFNEKLSGITVLRRADSHVVAFACKSLILAGGGYAGIFRGHSTNAQENSGDVIAAALRAGMRLSNMEFVQFHPTTLLNSGALISEAARGEGAVIVDEKGERFTDELQTRDKLSRDILKHQLEGHKTYLDMRQLGKDTIEKKLPSTRAKALSAAGVDIVNELLEITPSAHYSIGGIYTRSDTSTDMARVFACGECAVTGVHGANRLGGNSLLESAYFGKIAGINASKAVLKSDFLPIDYAQVEKESRRVDIVLSGEALFNINSMRKNLGDVLFKSAGVFRRESSLLDALSYVSYLISKSYGLHCVNKERDNNVELISILEFKNALIIAESMILSALKRRESRGVHFREDFPQQDDRNFGMPSYTKQLSSDLYEITFEENTIENLWYKFTNLFNLQRSRDGKSYA